MQGELEAQRYFAAKLDERRREPRDDILTGLCNARLEGTEPLDNGEIYSLLGFFSCWWLAMRACAI